MVVLECTKQDCIWQLCFLPFLVLLIGSLFFLRSAITFCRKNKHNASKGQSIFGFSFLVVGFSALIYFMGHLLSVGIYLPFESERESLTIVGTVENIASDPFSPKFYIGDSGITSRASIVTIGNTSYYFLDAGALSNGSTVEIHYLPKSKIVCFCKYLD